MWISDPNQYGIFPKATENFEIKNESGEWNLYLKQDHLLKGVPFEDAGGITLEIGYNTDQSSNLKKSF